MTKKETEKDAFNSVAWLKVQNSSGGTFTDLAIKCHSPIFYLSKSQLNFLFGCWKKSLFTHIIMALLKFFQAMLDLPDSVIEWQWLVSSQLLIGKKLRQQWKIKMRHVRRPMEYMVLNYFYVLKLELGFTSVANKSVVQSGMRANFSVLALTYMTTLLWWCPAQKGKTLTRSWN